MFGKIVILLASFILGVLLTVGYYLTEGRSNIIIQVTPSSLNKHEVKEVIVKINDLNISFNKFGKENIKSLNLYIKNETSYEISAKFKNGNFVSVVSDIVKPGYITHDTIKDDKIVHRIRSK